MSVELEMRLSEHPRARAGIRRAKGMAGLLAFVVVALLAARANLPLPDVALRALVAGVVAYFIGWGVAVAVWKQIALAELEQARQRREARLAALTAPSDPAQ